jgi:hypothetical protein
LFPRISDIEFVAVAKVYNTQAAKINIL